MTTWLAGFWGQETGSFKFAKQIVEDVLSENAQALDLHDYASVASAIFERFTQEKMHDPLIERAHCLKDIQYLLEVNHLQKISWDEIAGRIITALAISPEKYGGLQPPTLTEAQRSHYGSDYGLNDR